jgi:hypothetical protein
MIKMQTNKQRAAGYRQLQAEFEAAGKTVLAMKASNRAAEFEAAGNKRQAYDIRFRCTLNGCDWTIRLFLKDPADAFDIMYKRLRYTNRGPGEGKLRYAPEFYRVVSCEVSADQSRGTA